MKILMQIIFVILFTATTAFPSVGTSTGFMRQKIMLQRNVRRKYNMKISNNSNILSMAKLVASVKKARTPQDKLRDLFEIINDNEIY